ncbi:MAG TPA: carboxymuconolactone decarboxylase family protein, partial [Solirubrobacterales bacterium]|nr:carboxymuconolactone decarboxylase family protein [Solirubrobacterales bacterium]
RAPRIPPFAEDEGDPEVIEMLNALPAGADGAVGEYNIFRTLARHPDLFRSWLGFGGYLLVGGTLPPRDRELMILRTAVRCRSSYEWGQHVRISLRMGIERETIDRVLDGPGAAGWADHESTLMRAVDELHDDARISDSTWDALADHYDERQLIEVAMLIGQYHMVAFALNSLGVELDEGLEPLPDARG